MRAKIIAVDFDGTLVEDKWPSIGATNEDVLDYCKREQEKGARIILWTNRVEEPLANAVKWCEENGLRLDAVNDNLQESVDLFGFNTRKIYADEFIDDHMAKGFVLPYHPRPKYKIKEMSPEDVFAIYQREKMYLNKGDPVINYAPHETIPGVIKVEHYSGRVESFCVYLPEGEC